jgi:hypothetical protein
MGRGVLLQRGLQVTGPPDGSRGRARRRLTPQMWRDDAIDDDGAVIPSGRRPA